TSERIGGSLCKLKTFHLFLSALKLVEQHMPCQKQIYQPLTLVNELARNLDRKSTRLNSSHVSISYAVFCLKKKKNTTDEDTTVQEPTTLDKRLPMELQR